MKDRLGLIHDLKSEYKSMKAQISIESPMHETKRKNHGIKFHLFFSFFNLFVYNLTPT